MIEWLKETITQPYLLGFVLSMIPVVELKGAIPVTYFLLGQSAQNAFAACAVCVMGASLPVPFLLLFFTPLIAFFKRTKFFSRLATAVERRFLKKAGSLQGEREKSSADEKKILRAKYWGLFLFTAIPLPFTGSWTASCVAAILQTKKSTSFFVILVGNFVAGLVVSLVTLLGGTLL